jgi:hypothetical protein
VKLRHGLLATAMLVATPANAATYLITYTGTVYLSNDTSGEFGLTGLGVYDGMPFTAVYTLTAPLPGAVAVDTGSTAFIFGGANYGTPSPVSGVLTINGVSMSVSGNHSGVASQDNRCCTIGRDEITHGAGDSFSDGLFYSSAGMGNMVFSYTHDFVTTHDYTSPLQLAVDGSDIQYYGRFSKYESSDGRRTFQREATGLLNATNVTIALSSAVPEPATWATMIFGMGIVGATMRRSRRTPRVRYSFN